MPNVGSDGQPLLERAMYGYDGADWQPLSTDSDGHPILSDLWTFGSLAAGQLAASEADIYAVPASTEAANIEVHLFNTHTVIVEIVLYVQRSGGTSYEVLLVDMEASSALLFAIGALSAGDKIRGEAGSVDKVNYTIVGATR